MSRSPPGWRPPPKPPKIAPERLASAVMAMDAYAKGELVRTPFDNVLPGLPPALRIRA